jgi:hypothetical protein
MFVFLAAREVINEIIVIGPAFSVHTSVKLMSFSGLMFWSQIDHEIRSLINITGLP